MISRVSLCSLFPSSKHTLLKKPRLKKKVKKKDSSPQTESPWHWFHSEGRGCLSAPLHLIHSSLSAPQIYFSRAARKGPLPESTAAWPSLMEGENAIVPCSCFTQDTKTQPQRIHVCSSAPLHYPAEKKTPKKQNVKIDLPPKVGEEKWTTISDTLTHTRRCFHGDAERDTHVSSVCSS